jgi:fido (protein-threonine AMPylation protein)
MEIEFAKLRKANFLRGADAEAFSSMAASFAVEIDAAHPLVEGNGRVQRLFLQILADQAGYELTLLPSDKDGWNAAAKEGFFSNPDAMKRLIMARLKKK